MNGTHATDIVKLIGRTTTCTNSAPWFSNFS